MANIWSNETPEQRENRLAFAACMNADVAFRAVREGLCYFEVYFTDDLDGPGVSILGNNKAHISSECGLLFVSKED